MESDLSWLIGAFEKTRGAPKRAKAAGRASRHTARSSRMRIPSRACWQTEVNSRSVAKIPLRSSYKARTKRNVAQPRRAGRPEGGNGEVRAINAVSEEPRQAGDGHGEHQKKSDTEPHGCVRLQVGVSVRCGEPVRSRVMA